MSSIKIPINPYNMKMLCGTHEKWMPNDTELEVMYANRTHIIKVKEMKVYGYADNGWMIRGEGSNIDGMFFYPRDSFKIIKRLPLFVQSIENVNNGRQTLSETHLPPEMVRHICKYL
mgnify:FL=1